MYLKITDRCNMLCDHCGMNATRRGRDMSPEVFQQALKWCYEDSISIGGGEPTIHPDFWSILAQCLGTFEYVWMATNGKETETALKLAKLAEKGILGVALSQDPYHEQIEQEVVRAFTKAYHGGGEDGREIRDTSHHLIAAGRAKTRLLVDNDECICSDMMILPDGRIKFCGCARSPIVGNVYDGILPEYEQVVDEKYQYNDCYRQVPRSVKRLLHTRASE